jgi:hypothetical protein
MKYIVEYNRYDKYIIVNYDDNFEDPNAVDFEVTIQTPEGDEVTIDVNYQMFLEFIRQVSPQISSYIRNHEELNSFENIFSDLQELGFDFKDYLQQWVDVNINPENLEAMK